MPTENELKYVLKLESQTALETSSYKLQHIRQGYLAVCKGMSLRVRAYQEDEDKIKYKLTYKQKVNGRVCEIEKKIDTRDFHDLWEVTMNRLEKVRYSFWVDDECWEIDLFLANGGKYFAMAEVEMPEARLTPNSIPDIVSDHLLYAVPLDDDRFASKRIADVKHALEMYEQLCQEKQETQKTVPSAESSWKSAGM